MFVERCMSWTVKPLPGGCGQELGQGKASLADDNSGSGIEAFRKPLKSTDPCLAHTALNFEGNGSSSACQNEIHFAAVFSPVVQLAFRYARVDQMCANGAFYKAPPIAAVRFCFLECVSRRRLRSAGLSTRCIASMSRSILGSTSASAIYARQRLRSGTRGTDPG